jgi:riboflavin kinase/FMN adenylyltransferase
MEHYWSLEEIRLNNAQVTIGSFDGVHLGHQEIIQKMNSDAHLHNDPSLVITFFPHPKKVLYPDLDHYYLTSPLKRASLIGELGVDYVVTHPFNKKVANTSAEEFVRDIYHATGMSQLWIGRDFALGKGRKGNLAFLRDKGLEFNFSVNVVKPITLEGEQISSSRIRSSLKQGNLEKANRLLGRRFQLVGDVVPGDGRGKLLGIPTANLEIWNEQIVPNSGVYVCLARLGDRKWGAVTNIGVRPTFSDDSRILRVEAHLLNFAEEIYSKKLDLTFITRLRDEKRFTNEHNLVKQILEDIEQAKMVLADKIV